jgi:ankyrin repeat protein
MVAAKLGYSKVVLYLLALQANANETDAQGFTALMHAAHGESRAAAFCPTSSGMVFRNYAETMRLLLRHGAEIDISNNRGDTALDIAHASGNATLIRILEAAQKAKPPKGTRVCLK